MTADDRTDPPADLPADLLAGYARFRRHRYPVERDRYRSLADEGQRPRSLVIACSDSRSAPETVFDAGPGGLFVVRNVGALVPVYAPDAASHGASAALEFGVRFLSVPSIVVMGHGRCGGIAAALAGIQGGGGSELADGTDFIGAWVRDVRTLGSQLQSVTDPDARRLALERRSVERSIVNLRTFPWIAERERGGELALVGAWFDISLGELHVLGREGWRAVGSE